MSFAAGRLRVYRQLRSVAHVAGWSAGDRQSVVMKKCVLGFAEFHLEIVASLGEAPGVMVASAGRSPLGQTDHSSP